MKMYKSGLLIILISIIACKKGVEGTTIKDQTVNVLTDSLKKPAASQKAVYEIPSFDNPESANKFDVIKGLRELDNAGVFDSIHSGQLGTLSDIHFGNLKSLGRNYKLLYVADGSVFAPNSKDKAIIAYEPDEKYLAILLLNGQNGNIGELYRDYKVENGLNNANCNYSAFGTLDYQLASEIVYFKDDLLKNPKSFLENIPCLITDFSKNENYAPEGGCFSPNAPKLAGNVLCIATSFVYNNWECLKYDKNANSFLICYGQAFAD